ncbi:hypothetical protein HanRHA438_Chr13g0607051 [Helianthus annuus]|nr:hypothetical protein HanRHA438_Chr13g0607051 [Helianthus annuus]
MELTRWMKMARFQYFWTQMRKNKPLDESRKTGQTSRTKMEFYSMQNEMLYLVYLNRSWRTRTLEPVVEIEY